MQEQAGIGSLVIHPVQYRAVVAGPITALVPSAPENAEPGPAVVQLQARIAELEREFESRTRDHEAQLQTARAEARELGRQSERTAQAMRLDAAAAGLGEALQQFHARRDRYLAEVEREVVKLALAIAARVMRREALLDPLLLAGAVRVALGQLAEGSKALLKVPAGDHAMWGEMLRLMPNLPLRPEVVADEALATGDCLLEAQMGTVDLGVRSQLAEIERGFFDLLEKREKQSERFGDQSLERSAISAIRRNETGRGAEASL